MKRKLMMAICTLTITAAMVTACGNNSTSTEAQTESAAETEIQTEAQTQEETAAETETVAEAETESETAAPAETETEEAAAEPKTMYVVSDVYVRQEPDASSEAVAVAYLGDEVTAVDVDEKWCKVTLGEKEGYVVKEYLTESKEEADQAVKSEEAAQAAAEAAAAAAAAQQSQSSGGSGRYEVSRQAYPDCDGSGHGYYEITYSDGSVETVDY